MNLFFCLPMRAEDRREHHSGILLGIDCNPSMEIQLENLIELQIVDLEIAKLTEEVAIMPKRVASIESEFEKQQLAGGQVQKAVLAEEAKRRRLESDLKDWQQRIIKFRDQASGVKTNEQFHALQHEIGFVEAEIRRVEDEELASMMQSESLERELQESKQIAAAQRARLEKEKEAVRIEIEGKTRELDDLRKQRTALRATIDAKLLAEYDRLAGSSRKTALARASGQRCFACQMALRPQYWNDVRSGVLLNCESCGRLLYFDSRYEPVTEPSPGK